MATKTSAARTSAVTDALHPALWGLCPRCHTWFDCSGWQDLPAPPCPRCFSPAQRVVREDDPAGTRLAQRTRGRRPTEIWIG